MATETQQTEPQVVNAPVAGADAGARTPPGHKGTKAEEAAVAEWRATGVIPSGYGLNFDYDPPLFKLPEEEAKRIAAGHEADRKRAEALEGL